MTQLNESRPFFSIIIPTYNRAHLLPHAISTVLAQSYQNFELIIIDDASTDDTEKIVKAIKDQRIIYHKQPVNKERSAARNLGVKMSRGTFVNFFDSDDLLYPNHLTEAVKNITDNVAVYYQRSEVITDGKTSAFDDNIEVGLANLLIYKGNVLSMNGVFIKREVALKNPFREDMNQSEDYELWLRLVVQFDFFYSPTVTSAILQHLERGINTIAVDIIIKNKEKLLAYLQDNSIFMNQYKTKLPVLFSNAYFYISLYAMMAGKITIGWKFFFLAVKYNPGKIMSRKAFAIVKKSMLHLLK